MSIWHIVLSIGVIAVAALIGYALSKARKKKPDSHLSRGVTFDQPQQEVTEKPGPPANREPPLAKDRGARS